MRLNKFISECGVASRRKADDLILGKKVKVNGKVVTELGHRIDPEKDKVEIYHKTIIKEKKRYLILNKPKFFVTTLATDEFGKKSIVELISDIDERVFPVGRLDYDSEGLLLLTNDGDFANRIHHPKYGVRKVYIAEVEGTVDKDDLNSMEQGTILDSINIRPDSVRLVSNRGGYSTIEITFHEGKKHLVKRYLKNFNHPVKNLKRVEIGGLKIGNLKPGKWRNLTENELSKLKRKAGLVN